MRCGARRRQGLAVRNRATHVLTPRYGTRLVDDRGGTPVGQGDTDDVGYVAPSPYGLSIFQPVGAATLRGFEVADNAIMDGADVTVRLVFKYTGELHGSNRCVIAKSLATGNNKEWRLDLRTTSDLFLYLSDDGATTQSVGSQYGALGVLTVDTWYAVQFVYDESAGQVIWTTHTVANALAGDWSQGTDSETDGFSAITIHNGTGDLTIGGYDNAGSLTSASDVAVRYAQVVFDGGTVTIDPERDADGPLDTSWTDSDSGLTVASQAISSQSDWPRVITGKALDLPGDSGDYASAPDENDFDVTGDIDLRWYGYLDEWDSGNFEAFISKSSGASQRSYQFDRDSDGALRFVWTENGSTFQTATSSVDPDTIFSDGEAGWVRVTVDVDNGASDAEIKFYTSTDGITWSQLGSTQLVGATTSIHAGTAVLAVGANSAGTTDRIAGQTFEAQVYDGIDGALVADFRPSHDYVSGSTFVSSRTGETWTINGNASIVASTVPFQGKRVYFNGSAFALTQWLATFAATTGECTVIAPIVPETTDASDIIFNTWSQDGDGLNGRQINTNPQYDVFVGGDGTDVSTADQNFTVRKPDMLAAVVNASSVQVYTISNGMSAAASTSGVGTVTHAPLVIGANAYNDGAIARLTLHEDFLILEEALDAAELDALVEGVYGLAAA